MTTTKRDLKMKSPDGGKKMRTVGRWYIGETLGKGGYSWVKKGFDKKTGKCVALKFMAKADESWAQEQSKQVVTEIESLKHIRHPNVMKLFAYNLNAKYPTSGNRKVNTILLVLEYAPGGEIFDLLYYTSALEEVLARTYFRQAIFGLEACHNAGVAHRDIKPQNLLLDSRFNIKLTDFGLSKVFESDADAIMSTTYVGTKGYQAPELLQNKSYDVACDVFSMAVVLFILITGYPPFEQAHLSDRWFKPLGVGNFSKFWKYHRGCSISKNNYCKDLLQRMFAYDPKQRITIAQIKKHPWFNAKFLEGKELIRALRHRYRAMEASRKKDANKMNELNESYKPSKRKNIPGAVVNAINIPVFPAEETEGIYHTYTTVIPVSFVHGIQHIIEMHNGRAALNPDGTQLNCRLKLMSDGTGAAPQQDLTFLVEWWKSREYYVQDVQIGPESDQDEMSHSNVKREPVYCVRMRRLEGSLKIWQSVRQMVFTKGRNLFTGLPAWTDDYQPDELGMHGVKGYGVEVVDEEDYSDIDWD